MKIIPIVIGVRNGTESGVLYTPNLYPVAGVGFSLVPAAPNAGDFPPKGVLVQDGGGGNKFQYYVTDTRPRVSGAFNSLWISFADAAFDTAIGSGSSNACTYWNLYVYESLEEAMLPLPQPSTYTYGGKITAGLIGDLPASQNPDSVYTYFGGNKVGGGSNGPVITNDTTLIPSGTMVKLDGNATKLTLNMVSAAADINVYAFYRDWYNYAASGFALKLTETISAAQWGMGVQVRDIASRPCWIWLASAAGGDLIFFEITYQRQG